MNSESVSHRGETLIREILAGQSVRSSGLLSQLPNGDCRVGSVIEKMQREYTFPYLSIECLAQSVKITPVQLRKLFRRDTGMGPKHFLNALRMRKAAQMLLHGSARVKEVAAACGFTSDHYFHPAFRKKFGCTPSMYRCQNAGKLKKAVDDESLVA